MRNKKLRLLFDGIVAGWGMEILEEKAKIQGRGGFRTLPEVASG
jgi:hypothetical protein